ncbi:WSC domain containing protein [Rhypophila sp. PSN 637]
MASILLLSLRAVTLLCLLAPVDALRGREQCSVPTRFSALGCYVDNDNGRALTGPSFRNEGMTVKACRRACSTFEYFGVENSVECFCGDTLNASTAAVGECSFPCGGNATETCGAVNRLNVFKKDGIVVSSTLSSIGIPTAPASSTPASTQSSSRTSASSSASSTGSESLTSTILSTEPSSPSSSSASSLSSSSTSSLSSSTSSSSSSSISTSSSSSTSFSSEVPTTASTTLTTSTTSTFSVPSTTAAALPTSTTSTTSTTSQCPLTTSMTVGSTACWGSIPSPCSTLSLYLGAAAGSTAASSCLTAFMSGANTVHPSIAPCFSNLPYPTFSPQRAYTCVSNAGSAVYCPSTTKCIPTTGPLQTNLIPNGNFNSGANIFDPWILTYSSGSEPMISHAITSERARSALFSLKIYYNNQDPGGERQWSQDINGLVPGVQYELSYYWWQNFGQTRMSSYIRFLGPGGVSVVAKEFSHFNTGAGVWTKVTETFVPGASFGRVVFGARAVRGGGQGTLWIDDVFVKRLAW